MITVCPQPAMGERDAADLSPLNLAYIGDTVFDLFVRTRLVAGRRGGAAALHKMSAALVNARAQAAFAQRIEPQFTEQERSVFLRGRNAKSGTIPKNMSVTEYRHATALEAVIGYLYLTGQSGRLNELLEQLENGSETRAGR